MTDIFDETRLDDPACLERADRHLRNLAEAGARVRREASGSAELVGSLAGDGAPRAVVAAGTDARLLRAVLEPWSPVPFVAWPGPGLPGWAGTLDLVVVLSPEDDPEAVPIVAEANRRGCLLVVACPEHSLLAEASAGRHRTLLPTQTHDALAVAVVMLQALHKLGVGTEVVADDVAHALDEVAVECSPHQEVGFNPGKDLALALADDLPLVWGGSVLAARAARRVAEALRRSSGRPALAADARHLLPVIAGTRRRDVFADPFADPTGTLGRPGLVVLDDRADDPSIQVIRRRLDGAARDHDVRVDVISTGEESPVARYASLLASGLYAAAYLAVGLGREQATA